MKDTTPYEEAREVGVQIPKILLPAKNIDLTKWSVVACDQYTSQPEYWEKAKEIVGDASSTLHMILPEVYLEEDDKEERIQKINQTMQKYLLEGILTEENPGFIYVDRQTCNATSRKGLIIAVDLEKYDYHKGSQTLIRATEGTVLDRLPPRIKIREHAPVEAPHIMLLIDDPEKTVIEPLAAKTDKLQKLYDFELMLGGMHIQGYKIDSPEIISEIIHGMRKLADPVTFRSKYNVGPDKGVLLFAAGDGNHSLASAKGHWENVRKTLQEEEKLNHPARYALVEIVNVHDDGLMFEPIHRVVFNIDTSLMLDNMVDYYNHAGSGCSYRIFDSEDMMKNELIKQNKNKNSHLIPFVTAAGYGIITVSSPKYNLELGTLQTFLDSCGQLKIDYIHGDNVVDSLGREKGNIGFFLPSMDKHDLFKTVILDGVLPRKTFSMGEAEEKRFYLECRKIRRGT